MVHCSVIIYLLWLFMIRGGIAMKSEKRRDNKGRILKTGEYQRSNGSYTYKYKDLKGKMKNIYAKDLTELRKKEKEIQRDLDDWIDTDAASRTLNQQFERYMGSKPNLANSTFENYWHFWNKHIKDSIIGNKKLSEIRKSDILFFYTNLKKDGIRNTSIQLYQNILYPCFQLAVDDNIIRSNPCKDCMKEFSEDDSRERESLSVMQQQVLLEYTKKDKYYDWYYPLFVFILETGCRRGEALGITWKDIDFKNKTINIDHQLIYKKKDGKCQFYISKPKTKSGERIIPMSDQLYTLLEEYKRKTIFTSKASRIKIDGYQEFVFLNKEGGLIYPQGINRALDKIINQYNEAHTNKLPHISIHSLRHTACTRMAEKGMDVKVLQYIMGHANISVTMEIYNHVDLDRIQKEMQRIEKII